MNKAFARFYASPWGTHRVQPQRDMRWLHRLPYHPCQFVAQRVQVRHVSQFGAEGFEDLGRVDIPPVKILSMKRWMRRLRGVNSAAITRVADHDGKLRRLLLAGDLLYDSLGCRYAPEVHQPQRDR